MQAERSSATQVAEDYLTAFCGGDFEGAREFVAEDFAFEGPFTRAESREEFFASAAPLQPMLRGLSLLRKWEDGDESCWIYDLNLETPAGTGAVTISDWLTVRDGLVARERLLFDTAAWAALMPR
jgi:SnoaL-like domain